MYFQCASIRQSIWERLIGNLRPQPGIVPLRLAIQTITSPSRLRLPCWNIRVPIRSRP